MTTTSEEQPLAGLTALPISRLRPSPNNPREHYTDIDELAASIQEVGLIQPIVVQRIPGQTTVQIVAGHRRWRAAELLGWAKVPCIIRRDMLPDEELLTMLIENGQRANLDPIEEARALYRLKAGGLTDLQIAGKVGRSQSYVSARLALLALPVDEQEQIRAGVTAVTPMVARARTLAGKVRRGPVNGHRRVSHLGPDHDLARLAKARCLRLGHSLKGGRGVGGTACGECWESVIRADERQTLHEQSEQRHRCVLCDTPHDPDNTNQ